MAAEVSGGVARAHLAMAAVQLFNGGYHVVTTVALNDGVNQFVFCIFRDLLALSILAPVTYFCEKRERLPLNRHLLVMFAILGFTGIFGNQLLFLLGLSYTNPSCASAIQLSIPVFTFIFAVLMGIETINLRKIEGLTKLGGTLICVSGAILMAIYRGPAVFGSDESLTAYAEMSAEVQPQPAAWLMSNFLGLRIDSWHLGVLCLIGNCICMAAFLTIQGLHNLCRILGCNLNWIFGIACFPDFVWGFILFYFAQFLYMVVLEDVCSLTVTFFVILEG